MNFGERLRGIREDLDIKQKDLAERCNISTQVLSNYENGRREPDLKTVVRLAEELDVSLEYLITGHNRTRDAIIELIKNNGMMLKQLSHTTVPRR